MEGEVDDGTIFSLLGDLGVSDKFRSSTTIVEKLSKAWDTFRNALDKGWIRNVDLCFQNLLRHSAKIVFNLAYLMESKVDDASKSKLIESVQNVSGSLLEAPSLQRVCTSFADIARNPWSNLTDDVSELSDYAIDELWSSEGWLLLEERMETMYKARITAKVFVLLHVCVTKGKEWYWNDDVEEMAEDDKFNPYRCSLDKYLEYLQAYALLWNMHNNNSNLLSSLPPKLSVQIIKRLRCTRVATADKTRQFLPKLWKTNVSEVVLPLVEVIMWKVLTIECHDDIPVIEDLLYEWMDISLKDLEELQQYEKIKSLKEQFLRTKAAGHIVLSDYVYSFAEVILKKLGLNTQTRIMFLEVYVGTMTDDMNMIEIIKTETPPDSVKLDKELKRLSKRELRMADFFKTYPKTSREFCLTAFSLNPTEELFKRVFPSRLEDTIATSDIQETNEFKKTEDKPLCTEESREITFPALAEPALLPSSSLTNSEDIHLEGSITSTVIPLPPEDVYDSECEIEDLELPVELLQDVETLMCKPRWTAVGHFTKGKEQKELCSFLLKNREEVLFKEKDLEYVNVDYEKYKHLPSKYDANDDGIENGYRLHETLSFRRNGFKMLNKRSTGIRRNNGTSGFRGRPVWKKGVSQRKPILAKENEVDVKPYKSRELNAKLEKLKQFVNQNRSLSEFLTKHKMDVQMSRFTKAKNKKLFYKNAYLSQELDIPGVGVLLVPEAYNNSGKVPLQKPTGYVCQENPYRLKVQGSGTFEVDFRIERKRYPAKLRKDMQNRGKDAKGAIDFPESLDDQWVSGEDAWDVNFSAPVVGKSGFPSNKDLKIILKRDSMITAELEESTKRYLSLKNEAIMSRLNTSAEGLANIHNTPTKKWVIVKVPTDGLATQIDSQEVAKGTEEENKMNFALGEVWEFESTQKNIFIHPGPDRFKRKQEATKKKMMISDATERMKKNLELKTYLWDSVLKEDLKAQLKENSLKTSVPQEPRLIGPLTEDEQRLLDESHQTANGFCDGLGSPNGTRGIPKPFILSLDQGTKSGDVIVPVGGQRFEVQRTGKPKALKTYRSSKGIPTRKPLGRPPHRRPTEESIDKSIEAVLNTGNAMDCDMIRTSDECGESLNLQDTTSVMNESEEKLLKSDHNSLADDNSTNVRNEEIEVVEDSATGASIINKDKDVEQKIVETKEEKPPFKITFPYFQSPQIRKVADLHAGKPVGTPLCPEDIVESEESDGANSQAVVTNSFISCLIADCPNLPESKDRPVQETEKILCAETGYFIDVPKDPTIEKDCDLVPCDDPPWYNESEESENDEESKNDDGRYWERLVYCNPGEPTSQSSDPYLEGLSKTLDDVAGHFLEPEPLPSISESSVSALEFRRSKTKIRNHSNSSTSSEAHRTMFGIMDCSVKLHILNPAEYPDAFKTLVPKDTEEPSNIIKPGPEPKRSCRIMSKDTRARYNKSGIIKQEKNKTKSHISPVPLLAYGENGIVKKRRKSQNLDSDTSNSLDVSAHKKKVVSDSLHKRRKILRTATVIDEVTHGAAPGKENNLTNVPSQESRNFRSVARKRTLQRSGAADSKNSPPQKIRTRQSRRHNETETESDTESGSDYSPEIDSESSDIDVSDNEKIQCSSRSNGDSKSHGTCSKITSTIALSSVPHSSVLAGGVKVAHMESKLQQEQNLRKRKNIVLSEPTYLPISRNLQPIRPRILIEDPLGNSTPQQTGSGQVKVVEDIIELSSDSEPELEVEKVTTRKFVIHNYGDDDWMRAKEDENNGISDSNHGDGESLASNVIEASGMNCSAGSSTSSDLPISLSLADNGAIPFDKFDSNKFFHDSGDDTDQAGNQSLESLKDPPNLFIDSTESFDEDEPESILPDFPEEDSQAVGFSEIMPPPYRRERMNILAHGSTPINENILANAHFMEENDGTNLNTDVDLIRPSLQSENTDKAAGSQILENVTDCPNLQIETANAEVIPCNIPLSFVKPDPESILTDVPEDSPVTGSSEIMPLSYHRESVSASSGIDELPHGSTPSKGNNLTNSQIFSHSLKENGTNSFPDFITSLESENTDQAAGGQILESKTDCPNLPIEIANTEGIPCGIQVLLDKPDLESIPADVPEVSMSLYSVIDELPHGSNLTNGQIFSHSLEENDSNSDLDFITSLESEVDTNNTGSQTMGSERDCSNLRIETADTEVIPCNIPLSFAEPEPESIPAVVPENSPVIGSSDIMPLPYAFSVTDELPHGSIPPKESNLINCQTFSHSLQENGTNSNSNLELIRSSLENVSADQAAGSQILESERYCSNLRIETADAEVIPCSIQLSLGEPGPESIPAVVPENSPVTGSSEIMLSPYPMEIISSYSGIDDLPHRSTKPNGDNLTNGQIFYHSLEENGTNSNSDLQLIRSSFESVNADQAAGSQILEEVIPCSIQLSFGEPEPESIPAVVPGDSPLTGCSEIMVSPYPIEISSAYSGIDELPHRSTKPNGNSLTNGQLTNSNADVTFMTSLESVESNVDDDQAGSQILENETDCPNLQIADAEGISYSIQISFEEPETDSIPAVIPKDSPRTVCSEIMTTPPYLSPSKRMSPSTISMTNILIDKVRSPSPEEFLSKGENDGLSPIHSIMDTVQNGIFNIVGLVDDVEQNLPVLPVPTILGKKRKNHKTPKSAKKQKIQAIEVPSISKIYSTRRSTAIKNTDLRVPTPEPDPDAEQDGPPKLEPEDPEPVIDEESDYPYPDKPPELERQTLHPEPSESRR